MKKLTELMTCFSISAALVFSACSVPDYSNSDGTEAGKNSAVSNTDYSSYSFSAMDVGSDFMRGVDASEVAALEELGQKWYDSDDTEKDLF